MGIKESISELRQKFDADLSEVRDSESIEKLRVSYLGKKGSVTELLKGLKDLSGAEKKEFGQTINTLKREVDERITAHVERIRQEEEDRLVNSAEQYDVTLPMDTDCGSYHPITLVQRELEEIFASMGSPPPLKTTARSYGLQRAVEASNIRSITPPATCRTPTISITVSC